VLSSRESTQGRRTASSASGWRREDVSRNASTTNVIKLTSNTLTLESREQAERLVLIALRPKVAAKRKQFLTHPLRKETALHVQWAIMPILSEVAPYDFRP